MTEHDTVPRDRREDWLVMNALHDAFRRDLEQLMHTTAGQAAIRSRWQTFRGQLHFHHTAEDTAMWPPVRERLASLQNEAGLALLDEMEAEHGQIGPLLAAVDDALAMNAERDRLRELLGRLQATLAGHLAHEEAEMLPLISSVMSRAEVSRIGVAIARRGGLRQAAEMFPWALAEASPQLRGEVLAQLPPPVRLIYRAVWLPRYRRRAAAL
jgi:iron-sulfur cluster repair protein YtfE (RIC family)